MLVNYRRAVEKEMKGFKGFRFKMVDATAKLKKGEKESTPEIDDVER